MRGNRLAGVLALAVIAGACEMMYAPTSPSAEWATFESPRFVLFARPDSFCAGEAAPLTELLEDQYSHAVSAMAIAAGGRISMFLYNAGSELNPPLPSPRSGVAFPETNAVHAVCVAPHDDNLRALLTHEANHVIMQNGLGRAGTSFMNEGLATALSSERFGEIGPTFVHRWVRANRARVPRIADLADDEKWNSNSTEGYRSSASFLAFLLERYGATPLKQLYYARSDDFARRASQVYGKSLDALEAEWLASI